jgi:hypothetical protein
MENLLELKTELSKEWNKPKAQNIKSEKDKREARSYKRIKDLQKQIDKVKNPVLPEDHKKNKRSKLSTVDGV